MCAYATAPSRLKRLITRLPPLVEAVARHTEPSVDPGRHANLKRPSPVGAGARAVAVGAGECEVSRVEDGVRRV